MAGLVYVVPAADRNPLCETTVWSLLILASFAGWGSLVKVLVAPKEGVDLGLRLAWGASAMCLFGGVMMVPAAMTRGVAIAIVELGVLAALVAIFRERDRVRASFAFTFRLARREPKLAAVALFLATIIALRYLGGVANWRVNPYDDDIAYIPFAEKLLQTGTFLEPFSVRRLSALGGQTYFIALVGVRAAASQAFTFDRSIAVAMVLALLLGFRDRRRRPSLLFTLLSVALFVTIPSLPANTASSYSGVAFFFALFRTLAWVGEAQGRRAAWQNAVVLALVASTTCTLRQSYLPIPVFLLGASYMSWALWRRQVVPVLREAALVAGFTLAALVPWFVVAWQSNGTFLYPIILGNSSPTMALRGASTTATSELVLLVTTIQEGLNIFAIGIFILAAAMMREEARRKPLGAFAFATLLGFVLLVHGLTSSDPTSIGRYAFGSLVAMVLAILLTASTLRARDARTTTVRVLVLIATFASLIATQWQLTDPIRVALHNVDSAFHSAPRSQIATPEADLYRRLQESAPPRERMLVMLDEPHYLDFRRNPIWNLDAPAYASVAPGMPYFRGSPALEAYFKTIGVAFVAFVKPGYSRYYYRRDYWVGMLSDESDIWRTFAPYFLDVYDNLVEIASRHRVTFDERGLTVVDLGQPP